MSNSKKHEVKRYSMENQHESFTGQHEGIIGVPDDSGEWVKSEDYDALAKDFDNLLQDYKTLSIKSGRSFFY
jgi:hypothetical protein